MKFTSKRIFLNRKFYLLVFYLLFSLFANAQYFINIESGVLSTGLNNIRNGANGTLFSLKNDFKSPKSPFLRIRFGFLLNQKHHFSILYAPLKLTVNTILNTPIIFNDANFEANVPSEAVYQFNSYRFTYNRSIINTNTFNLGLGVSAKIRDAGASLRNSNTFSKNFGIGFAPLINIITQWKISNKFGIHIFGEGIAASKGRAIDFLFTGTYEINTNLQANIGYRILDGGADGKNRYNFVQFHFAIVSLTYQFQKKEM